jgi:hypothetical protein
METGWQVEPVPKVTIGDPMKAEVQSELHVEKRKHSDHR